MRADILCSTAIASVKGRIRYVEAFLDNCDRLAAVAVAEIATSAGHQVKRISPMIPKLASFCNKVERQTATARWEILRYTQSPYLFRWLAMSLCASLLVYIVIRPIFDRIKSGCRSCQWCSAWCGTWCCKKAAPAAKTTKRRTRRVVPTPADRDSPVVTRSATKTPTSKSPARKSPARSKSPVKSKTPKSKTPKRSVKSDDVLKKRKAPKKKPSVSPPLESPAANPRAVSQPSTQVKIVNGTSEPYDFDIKTAMQEQFEWVSFSAPVERERAALQRLAKLSGAESFLKPFQGLTQNIDPDSTSCTPAESETPTRNSVIADTPAPPVVGCLSRAEPRLDVVSEEVHFRAGPLSGGRTAVRAASWETLLARPVHWMFALEGRPALLLVVAGVRTEVVCLSKATGCLIFSRIVPVPPVVEACCDKDVLCLLSDDCTLAAFRLEMSPPGLCRIFYESVRSLLPTLTRPLLSLAPSSAPLLGLSNGQVLCLPSFISGGWVRVDGLDYGLPPDTSPILPESPLAAIQKFSRLQIDDVKLHDATSDDVSWLRSTLEGLAERTVASEVQRQERPFELHQLMCASYIGSTTDILEWSIALFMLEVAQADLLSAVCRLYFRRTRGGTPISDVPLPDWIQYWRLNIDDLTQLLSQLLGRFYATDAQAEAIGATGLFRWPEGTACLPEVLANAILSASRLEETGDVIEQSTTSDIVNVVLNM